MLKNLDKFSLPKIEEQVLNFWKTNKIFKKAEKKNEGKKEFIFYEGPPTANGRPGIHHVLSRSFKDIVLRYKTMSGFKVFRRGGWDTHGLPVELEVEKKLGLKSKKDIEKLGIAKFNKHCKESVWTYKDEWERLTERMGYWLDLENPYITYKNSYIETLWWIVSQAEKKGLLYKAYKVLPWCTRCGTALSSHELAQGYKEVSDPSVYIKFHLKSKQKVDSVSLGSNAYMLSWTTTPWTLPGNVALAVGKKIDYKIATVEKIDGKLDLLQMNENERYVFSTGESKLDIFGDTLNYFENDFSRADVWIKNSDGSKVHVLFKDIKTVEGKDLVGLSYEPIFDLDVVGLKGRNPKAYKVYPADFVNTEEGTGIVHTAVMYGEDDYNLGVEIGLPKVHTVDESGKFVKGVKGLAGKYVKDEATEGMIFGELKKRNAFFRKRRYKHDYPFCWRCDTHVLYYARDSWFLEASKVKKEMIKSNKSINWTPEHIKEGRFGGWLENLKDWAISRERYWGTPLPVWECDDCDKRKVVKGIDDLSSLQGESNNEFFLMRHAESDSNTQEIVSSNPDTKDRFSLTKIGEKQASQTAKRLKKEKIDLIYASDFKRTKETAKIVGEELGIKVKYDKRIREIDTGIFDGRSYKQYHDFFSSDQDRFSKAPPNGENFRDVAKRVGKFLQELDKKNKDKKILVISHENPLWMMEGVATGWGEEKITENKNSNKEPFSLAKFKKVKIKNLPRNEWEITDLHKPFIDEVTFDCDCGGKMKRVTEVMDVWFDSGAMPFAQMNFPFSQGAKSMTKKSLEKIPFPAEYITEGIDQTRGWFYTLLSISTMLGLKSPYKNVVSLELVLDKHGKKMSKSKGNTVDPWEAADKYGMDAVRWFFYAANSPGEPKRFDESEINKHIRNFILTIYNSFVFLDTYQENKIDVSKFKPVSVMDKWIVSRLEETKDKVSVLLKKYDINKSARAIGYLVDDLSRWYIRRSRDRLQNPETKKEFKEATQTLAFVLLETSKLIAPFTPFMAEALYNSLEKTITGYNFKESVHLDDWSKVNKKSINKSLMTNMTEVRNLSTLALAKRQKLGLKVRQPLSLLEIKSEGLKSNKKLLEILADEVNVKKVKINSKLEEEVELDTKLNKQLKEEGLLRELVRLIQNIRRDADLNPQDEAEIGVTGSKELVKVLVSNKKFLKEKTKVSSINNKDLKKFKVDKETKINDLSIKITLK